MHNHKPESRGNPLVPSSGDVPLTLEGASILHQMMRIRWADWKAVPAADRDNIASEAVECLARMEQGESPSAAFSMLGHKGDLMFLHFRRSFDALNAAELELAALRLWNYLEPVTSYVSVVELGLYQASTSLYRSLSEKGVKPGSPEWSQAIEDLLERQRKAMGARLFPKMPDHRYICFYPMDRRRMEEKNWYTVPIAERARQMGDHGRVGRKYAGAVKQIISGSIGFDDWEWGVDLFADDPIVFKKLIYEMRFDEVSAVYAEFGPFYTGIRVRSIELPDLLAGKAPGGA
jgi:chlorite dismutase